MQAEINKYFPTDVSNLILEMHYKARFYETIIYLNNERKWIKERIDPDVSEQYYIKYFRNKIYYEYKFMYDRYLDYN